MIKLIQQGAEAKILLDEKNNLVIKDRIQKSYRIKEIDEKIRKQRTKAEKKLLEKACKIINAPNPLPLEDFDKIKMPFIKGKKLSENLDLFPLKKQKEILKTIGEEIAKLHDTEIIHGDLTTSNMILVEDKIFFIDFGLGYISNKIEDKAVDLHLLKHALEARHFKNWKILFTEFEKGYKNNKDSKKILERLIAVEKRGRYKEHD
ncbi:Kae1-associated serine/threonine protein kinase [Candidatus Pacearchaeota archaeon]|jgi:TP53 regulating kinase-like protein|nr:Kae1-associated serine/threonine protein kinase [Candidatus Pacearchaeota archaeon]